MTQVLLKTSFGDIQLSLNAEKAPKTVENFVNYVKEGFFDGLIFHRVIDNFMVQGGGMEPGMIQRPTTQASIQNEADNGLPNNRGTIAMARTMDPHSATGQFFINLVDNGFLNHSSKTSEGWGYCVFGEVTEGMDVVDRIKGVKTTMAAGHQDVPAEDIMIEKASIIEEA